MAALDSEQSLHKHCNTCIKIAKCALHPQNSQSCPIINCKLRCGAKFHLCKAEEHSLLCPEERIFCLNSVYGCPHSLLRKNLATHLPVCPAFVITCTMEWNRWPICTKERQSHVPFLQPNPSFHAQHGQLDVELLLRDQRVLNQSMAVPRPKRHVLSNDLTRRYPAMPFPSVFLKRYSPRRSCDREKSLTPSTLTDTDDDNPWVRRKAPPGLQQSVFNQLYKPIPSSERPFGSIGSISSPSTVPECDEKETQFDNHIFSPLEEDSSALSATKGKLNSNTNLEMSDTTAICAKTEELSLHSNEENGCPAIAAPPVPLIMTLGLDLTLVSISRFKTKPKSIYTFLCAQDFRRDEYAWHVKNVHSDIHGGLDNWMERRCPLYRYGCSYSLRRMFPESEQASVVYNSVAESFGVVPAPSPVYGQNDISLCDAMPFEVLQHITQFLDPFSLRNLALTCRLMREVCCSVLETRGIVVPQWERSEDKRWSIAYFAWSFSSCFTPVKKWGFHGGSHMSNHLTSCRFNVRDTEKKEPVKVVFGTFDDD